MVSKVGNKCYYMIQLVHFIEKVGGFGRINLSLFLLGVRL